eukprot:UN22071
MFEYRRHSSRNGVQKMIKPFSYNSFFMNTFNIELYTDTFFALGGSSLKTCHDFSQPCVLLNA